MRCARFGGVVALMWSDVGAKRTVIRMTGAGQYVLISRDGG